MNRPTYGDAVLAVGRTLLRACVRACIIRESTRFVFTRTFRDVTQLSSVAQSIGEMNPM